MRGETVGQYRIEDVLGQGGMGTVYRAVHTAIGKRAAVKVLRPDLARSDEAVQRFFNEARAAARIEHAGIIDVYDFGHAGDRAYLVMELLDGEPLSARLARGRVEHQALVRIARQIADALAAAHERGITHRDLKPDNVFLVPDAAVDGGVRVKLLDFGIAKLFEPDGSSSVETRTGAIIGTPVYMSPEQCRGTGELDHRSDLYSLGCILFQMVAGRPPFERAGVGELISAHLTEPPPPINAVRADVEPTLGTLIMRLLAKNPDHRVSTARDVVAVLDGQRSIEAPPARTGAPEPAAHLETLLPSDTDPDPAVAGMGTAPTEYQSTLSAAAAAGATGESPRQRSRTPLLAGVALIAIAAAGYALYARTGGGDEPSTAAAPPAAPVADAAPAMAEPALGLRFLDGFRTASGSAATPYSSPGGWRSAAQDFEAAAGQPGAPARWAAAAAVSDGYERLLSGDLDGGLAAMRRAVELDANWDLAHLGLARALSRAGDHEAALASARTAERISPTWWMTVAELGGIHRNADDLEHAIEEYQRALAMQPDEPLLLSALAICYHALRMDAAAADFAERALSRDPDMLSARLLLAERALEKGDGKVALEHAERVLARQPRSGSAKLAQADALLLLGKKDDARAAYQRALELVDELAQDGAPSTRIAAVRKALDAGKLPRPRHRERSKRKSGTRSKKSGGDRSRNTIDSPVYLDL